MRLNSERLREPESNVVAADGSERLEKLYSIVILFGGVVAFTLTICYEMSIGYASSD